MLLTKGERHLKNSFVMVTDTSFALNFLIYIQNIYLNQNEEKEKLRFPYLSTKMAFKDDFEIQYKELWEEVAERIGNDNINGPTPFYGEKDLFYQRLFVNDEVSLMDFHETYKTFEVWWNSFTGYFTIERSIDEKGQQLYEDISDFLVQKGMEPKSRLKISLIYDESLLADTQFSSYFAVLPIKEFFVHYEELVSKFKLLFS